jgi:serine O-acetyltransferase
MAMTSNDNASSNDLWQQVRREAEMAVAADPIFGGRLSAAILDHGDLGGAIAHQIGERLGKTEAERAQFAEIAQEAFQAAPKLVAAASLDLRAIAIHDPAVKGFLAPLLNFKGFVALQAFRVSHWLWSGGRTDLALLLQSEAADTLQVSIHPSARIGTSVFLDHATAIVVGAFVEIGDEATILHNVTVGRKGTPAVRAPRIGRGVFLSAGSTILGDIAIGDFAKIGAGAVVTSDVPAGCTAVGVPARLVNCPQDRIVA